MYWFGFIDASDTFYALHVSAHLTRFAHRVRALRRLAIEALRIFATTALQFWQRFQLHFVAFFPKVQCSLVIEFLMFFSIIDSSILDHLCLQQIFRDLPFGHTSSTLFPRGCR
jgi:hypothetical protein